MAETVGSDVGLLGLDPVFRLRPPPELVFSEDDLLVVPLLSAIVLGVLG